MISRVALLSSAALLAGLDAVPASAQAAADPASVPAPQEGSAAPTRTTTYDAAFFAPFAPRTALDMIRRLPGFTLDLGTVQTVDGDADTRGFAGTAGNVVINGSRPSSKAETIEQVLAKIPANRVARIDVSPGDLYGADYSSKPQVANVILGAGGGLAGTGSVSLQRHWIGNYVPNADLSAQLSRGPSTFTASAATNRTDLFEQGYDRVTDLETGDLIEFRDKVNRIHPHNPSLSAGWALDGGDNRSAHVNARFAPESFYLRQANHVTPVDGDERDDALHQLRKSKIAEIGGDVTRPLAGGGLKFLALANRLHRTTFEDYLVRGLGGSPLIEGSEQRTESQRNESLARLSWAHPSLAGFSVDTGIEVAWNTLDYALELADILADGTKVPDTDLPIANAKVTELRGEVFLSAGRAISPTFRIDGAVNYEWSKLKVSGDASARRSLRFLKPSLTLDWRPGDDWHTQLIVRRTVAQLDFYDFVSGVELSNDLVNGGNADLLPQRTWEGRFLVERPILGKGKARLEIGHDRVSLLQDRVLIVTDDGSFDAPGNLGTGTRNFARMTLAMPLDQLWQGLRADFNATVQRTRVRDPIDGELRSWSGFFPKFQWDLNVRRDSGKLAYGFDIGNRSAFYIFRTDSVAAFPNQRPLLNAFVEYRANPSTSLTFDAENLLDGGGMVDRKFYIPNRLDTDFGIRDYRYRNTHVAFRVTLKKSFGSAGVAN